MTADGVKLQTLFWLALALIILTIRFSPAILPSYVELFLNSALFQFLC